MGSFVSRSVLVPKTIAMQRKDVCKVRLHVFASIFFIDVSKLIKSKMIAVLNNIMISRTLLRTAHLLSCSSDRKDFTNFDSCIIEKYCFLLTYYIISRCLFYIADISLVKINSLKYLAMPIVKQLFINSCKYFYMIKYSEKGMRSYNLIFYWRGGSKEDKIIMVLNI